MDPQWLRWVNPLWAIAQNGLTHTRDRLDAERHEFLRDVAAEIAAVNSGADPRRVRGLFTAEAGPATPKVDVRAAVFRGSKILLIEEPEDGLWSPAGGWADVGEPPAEAVTREVYEESGYRTRATKLLTLYDRDRHEHTPIPYPIYKPVFLCEIEGGESRRWAPLAWRSPGRTSRRSSRSPASRRPR